MPAMITELILAAVFIGLTAAGVVTLLYARRHRRDRSDLRSVIVEDMKFIKERFDLNQPQEADVTFPEVRNGDAPVPPGPPAC